VDLRLTTSFPRKWPLPPTLLSFPWISGVPSTQSPRPAEMKTLLGLLLALIASSSSWAFDVRVNFQPKPDEPKSGLIWFNASSAPEWAEKLDNYLEVYRTPQITEGRSDHLVDCSYDSYPKDDEVCKINPQIFNPCVNTFYFGYNRFAPCVFIELDQDIGWKPKFYNSSKELPKSMPSSLKEKIEDLYTEGKMMEAVWISCEGETPTDIELMGPITYHPFPGFPGYLFPNKGQPGYLKPIVAIQFQHPFIGVLVSINCKLWSKGLNYKKEENVGMVSFELLIDSY